MTSTSEVAALREQIAELKEVISEQADRIDHLLRERAQDRQRLAELEEYRAENERDKATIRQQVTKVERTEAGTEGAHSDESDPENEPMTPMERLLRLGEDGIMIDVTASVRRAKAIAAHFAQWSSKTPNGLVVKDNLKSLLQTATNESLAWKQVYRAAQALEKFTKGAIRFEKHRRHGWMLIDDRGIASRLEQLRSSSVSEHRQPSG
jgi:hypothetical protein